MEETSFAVGINQQDDANMVGGSTTPIMIHRPPSRGSSFRLTFRQFLLLIWKGLVLRKRHWVVTLIELIIPLALITFYVWARSVLDLEDQRHENPPTVYNVRDPLESDYSSSYGHYSRGGKILFLFSPINNITQRLTDGVISKILKGSHTVYPLGVVNEEALYEQAVHLRDSSFKNIVGVVYENLEGPKLPSNLQYKIRLRQEFFTTHTFNSFSMTGPSRNDHIYFWSFLGLQAAIDRTFIEMRTNNSSDLKNIQVLMQQFPFPSYFNQSGIQVYVGLLSMVMTFGFGIMMAVFVKRMVDEKINRAKEMMRMMGLSDLVYFGGTFCNTYFLMVVIMTVTTILFKVPVTMDHKAVVNNTDGFLLWVILHLFAANALLFCMAFSTFFNKAVVSAIATFLVWSTSYSVPRFLLDPPGLNTYDSLQRCSKIATSLLPTTALHWAIRIISVREGIGGGTTWSNMFERTPGDNISLAMIMAMMLVSCLLCICIVWYVDNVWPWQPGIPKHPLFLFMRSYWCPSHSEINGYEEFYGAYADKSYFEDEPMAKTPGITISHLTKVFGRGGSRKMAVNDVSLNIYKGQITALLGHNGAGKTTTLNVITGLFAPTTGTAVINGHNILQNLKDARRSLGLCPQHNVLYENMTVAEHLQFFAGLKGRTFSEMKSEIDSCLAMLNLQEKKTSLAGTLSGGMKRKLSLGIAMIGGSEVLILDEPTSGMDPQARRAIWDLLQRIREERTIILTTHYMEEADILGDRIAIMAEGTVQCCGSPLFLKRKFGAGYNLRVSKGEQFNLQRMTACVQQSISSAYIYSDMRTEIGYILPVTDAEPFIQMFQVLEEQRLDIDYTSCGLTVTTMEDVFIKVGQLAEKAQETDLNPATDLSRGSGGFETPRDSLLHGSALWFQQIRGLLVKRFHDSRRYWLFLVFLILLPLAVIISMLSIKNSINDIGLGDETPLTLDLPSVYGPTESFYGGNDPNDNILQAFKTVLMSANAKPTFSDNITASALDIGQKDFQRYKHFLLVGGTVYRTGKEVILTAIYSGEAHHVSAMALNLADVSLLRTLTGETNATIRVINSPLPQKYGDSVSYSQEVEMDLVNKFILVMFFPLALAFLSASFVLFPIHERITKSKLIQLMTGVNGMTFWVTHFLWDFTMHIISSCFMLIPFVAMDTKGVYSSGTGAIGTLFLMLLLYGWSSIPLSYLLSFCSKKPSTGFVMATAINFIAGLILSTCIIMVTSIDPHGQNAEIVAWVLRFMPSFAMTTGAAKLDSAASHNIFCSQLKPSLLEYVCLEESPHSSHTRCCPSKCGEQCFKEKDLLSMDKNACGRELLLMFLTGFLFFFLLAVLESNLLRFWYRFWDRYKSRNQSLVQQDSPGEDSDVAKERNRVENLYEQGQGSEEALVAHRLTKNFGNINAVDHLTFSVHKDECFGLLGVNGAGKTTTFSMLTGDLVIGGGNAVIGRYSVKDHTKEFQKHVGYCPQFDAILDRLSGREALFLFARLRGVPETDIPSTVAKLIDVVDLQAHADKIAETYSGGNRRKLSLAMSLVGSPPVVFLDEPTAGVDPASRRKIWNTLSRVQAIGGTSFILTTHSMDECEALCGRLAIMVNGQFRCLGGIQYLKNKFGQGYTIIVKLHRDNFSDSNATEAVKTFFKRTFRDCVLKDVHQGMLHYHIEDSSFSWSYLFREMEAAKRSFNLEDYLISDTTLEQIFLAFARSQRIVNT